MFVYVFRSRYFTHFSQCLHSSMDKHLLQTINNVFNTWSITTNLSFCSNRLMFAAISDEKRHLFYKAWFGLLRIQFGAPFTSSTISCFNETSEEIENNFQVSFCHFYT